jgi:hypothetical protein
VIDNRAVSGAVLALFAVAVSGALLGAGLDSRAEFADSVQLGRNELVAGVVDLTVGSSSTPLIVDNLAPGDQSLLTLELRNDGTLPLLVTAELAAAQPPADQQPAGQDQTAGQDETAGQDQTAGQDEVAPGSELEIISWLSATGCRAEDAPVVAAGLAESSNTSGSDGSDPADRPGRLAPGESSQFCLSVGLPLSASNSAQGRAYYFTIIVTGVHDVSDEREPSE